jgi:hypothetical protein
MKRPRRRLRRAFVPSLVSAVMAAMLTGPALAGTQATPPGPTVKLVAVQNSVTASSFGGLVILDPGIYVTSLGSALQFDVQRASYTKPVTVAQVIHLPGGDTSTRPLPRSVLDGFGGLRDFARLTVTNASGAVVASSRELFCPNSSDPQRAVPDSAATSRFPQECALEPFPKSLVMGIAKGWGVDSFTSLFRLAPGTYKVTVIVTPRYVRLLHITHADARASVKVNVVKGKGSSSTSAPKPIHARLRPIASPSHVRDLAHPPTAALPDLIPLPAWQISTSHIRPSRDLLSFTAAIWVHGNSPLDVEGFRSNGSSVMKAYQYFWRNGQLIGRVRAGTMSFGSHKHWHIPRFTRYALLGSTKNLVVRSYREGFCIAPTDPVDLLAPHAAWQPPNGLDTTCGQPTALWVRETLAVGWGVNTYTQSATGESFDITSVPNGTYYIEVIANSGHLLRESTTRNDVSLRKVILGGTPAHRTVKVPAWHHIDPEH